LAAFDAALAEDALAMMSSGVSTAMLYTQIARDGFGLAAQAALGYSFGELSMLAALGVWPEAARAAAPRVSELFRTRLAGPKLAVREFWARVGVARAVGDEPWSSFLVLAPAAEVADVLERVESVFLTIVNTPGEVVIAGQPGACARILESRGWQHVRMPFAHAIHCDPMQSERNEFARLATLPTTEITGIRFYSAAAYTPVVLESATLAVAIADMSCRQFNFPRLVERVYADGVRVFVELGAAGACTRMIDACLGARDHVAVSINRRGAAEQDTITRLLARLFSHRVPLELAPLFGPSM
jgi:PfaB family protein